MGRAELNLIFKHWHFFLKQRDLDFLSAPSGLSNQS